MSRKDGSWNKLKDWYESLESEYQTERLKERFGLLDPLAVLSKLTTREMEAVVSLLAASNSKGWNQCRQAKREILQNRHNKPVFERRSTFKMVPGGAA